MEILHEETVALREAVLATFRYSSAEQGDIADRESQMREAWKEYDRFVERRSFSI